MWSKVSVIFLLLILPTIHGNLEDLQGSYLDDLVDKLILHIVEILRKGLLDADVDALPIPDFDWTLDVDNLRGVFEFREMTMFGLPDFVLQNVSTSLIQRKVELAVELPVIGVKGYYDFHAKLVGVPIWGGGAFTATFTKLEVAGGVQLNPAVGSLFSIKISSPFLSLGELNLMLEGLMGQLNPTNLILIILAIFIAYTILVLVVEYFIKKLRNKLKKPKVVD